MASISEGPGLLITQADCPPDQEAAFRRRYETRLLESVPGLSAGAVAWHQVEWGGPRLLALCHTASAAAFGRPDGLQLGLALAAEAGSGGSPEVACYVGSQFLDTRPEPERAPVAAPYAYLVFFNVPDQHWQEFDSWYVQEHLPLLLEVPAWRRCRRYRLRTIAGPTWTHLALHDVADLAAFESPELMRARDTPWRDRLVAQPWYKAALALYRPDARRPD